MPYTPYPIYNLRYGKATNVDPWLLPQDAFSTIRNMHLKYGVLEKRRGRAQFAQIIRTDCTTEADTHPANTLMGIYNYYQVGSAEKLLVMDTKRINKLNTSDPSNPVLEDVTRIKIHFKPGASQNIAPAADDVCEEAISGAYGTVESVVIDHGTFAGHNADGWIIFKNGTITGTFAGGQNLRNNTTLNIYGDSDGTASEFEFTGDDTNFFWWQNWQDKGFLVNGKNQICKYDGNVSTATPFQIDLDVEGGPDNDVNTCLMIFVVKNRIVLLNTTEKGTHRPARARWSNVNSLNFASDGWKDAPINDDIVSADFVSDELYVWFTSQIMKLSYTGDAANPFDWEIVDDTEGCAAQMSMTVYSDEAIAVGKTKILAFDRRSASDISQKIPDFLLETNQAFVAYDYGLVLEEDTENWISFTSIDSPDDKPDKILVFNYEDNAYSIYEIPAHIFGYWNVQTNLVLDDLPDGVSTDDFDYSLDDKSFQAGYPTTLMGGRDGWLYRLNYGGNDNGDSIPMEAKGGEWNPYVQQARKARLGWIDFLVDNNDSDFDVSLYVNSKNTPYKTQTVICTDSDKDRVKIWKRVYSGAIGSFHCLDISQDDMANTPRIHCIIPYFKKAGPIK